MRIEKIDEIAYKNYLEADGNYKFLQSYEQVVYSKNNNRSYYLLGMFDQDNKLVKAVFVLVGKYARFFKKAYINMYDFQDENVDKNFLNHICQFLKKEGISLLYLTSSQSINTRDEKGKIIGCSDEQKALINLVHQLGFKEAEYDEVTSYAYQYVKDISSITTEEELIISYRRDDRRKVRQTMKNGLFIERASRKDLAIFQEIFNKSALRQGFFEQPLHFFESYYDAYEEKGNLDFMICYLDKEAYLKARQDEVNLLKQKLPKIKNPKEEEKKIKALEDRIEFVENIKTTKVPISCALFVESKDEYVYFLGGNDLEYKDYLGAYYIQHKSMMEAINRGGRIRKYNFFGTVGAYIKDRQKGVYDFKKRFRGYPEELGIYKKVLSKKNALAKLLNKLMGK